MPAFNSRHIVALQEGVAMLFERMQAVNEVSLSHADIIGMVAPEEDRDLLFRIPQVAMVWGHPEEVAIGWPTIYPERRLAVRLHGAQTPFFPKNPILQRDTPPELIARITTWLERRIEIGRDFGRVNKLLTYLDDRLSAQQLRYVWPSILILCGTSEVTQDVGQKLSEFKAPKNIPTLPLAIREACRTCAGTITSASLLPPLPDNKPHYPVELRWEGAADTRFQEEGLGSFAAM